MKPLRAALIVKNTPASLERDLKNVGYFSYPVPEFTWEYFSPGKGVSLELDAYRRKGFDFVFHVDGGNWCRYTHPTIPVVYYTIDSTLSENHHFQPRFEQAARADLVLVDHDSLGRFDSCGKPVRRWLYCVNDRLFVPGEKTVDVNFQCGGSAERSYLRVKLSDLCAANGLVYKSGVRPLPEYAETMGHSKLVVVKPRTNTNRPHRIYDAMAAGALVVSYPFPIDEGEHFRANMNYLDLDTMSLETIAHIVEKELWVSFAEMGRRTVLKYHTWATRATELRALLEKELGL